MPLNWRRAGGAGALGTAQLLSPWELDSTAETPAAYPSSLRGGRCRAGVGRGGQGLATKGKVQGLQPSQLPGALCGTGCCTDTARRSRVSPQQENVWEFWSCSTSFFFF